MESDTPPESPRTGEVPASDGPNAGSQTVENAAPIGEVNTTPLGEMDAAPSGEETEGKVRYGHAPKKRPILLKGGRRFMREKLQGKTFLIPSLITVAGTFCGFLAIISAIKGRYDYATKCIALAFLLDGLDGRVARSLNATSAFGREFDSLSDLVAFGVAPAILVYCWAFSTNADEFGILVAFVFVICGATRLARFNVTSTNDQAPSHGGFTGLPIPGAAAAICALVYCFPEPVTSLIMTGTLMVFMVVIACLMVSTLPYFSIKHVKLKKTNPALLLVLLSAFVALIWKFNYAMILILAVSYALSGLVDYGWRTVAPGSWNAKQRMLRKVAR